MRWNGQAFIKICSERLRLSGSPGPNEQCIYHEIEGQAIHVPPETVNSLHREGTTPNHMVNHATN
jgi:hypothetical protein